MMDFLFDKFKNLLIGLLSQGYELKTLENFMETSGAKSVILRHDVDRNPLNALKTARIEAALAIKASYYFRTIKNVFDESIISEIAALGHEIGYHYENMDYCNGNVDEAYNDFCTQLEKIRKLYPVQTFCMHGSPMSPFDNRDLWKKYDYKKLGLIAEPYFDIDFNKVFYITDASRSWNNKNVSVRDKVKSSFDIKISSVEDIIRLANENKLPEKIMLNIHPHNWAGNTVEWMKIYTH